MYKILKEWTLGDYKILELDHDFSAEKYSKYRIDGKNHEPVPVHDFPRHIAIKGQGIFSGKTVEFV